MMTRKLFNDVMDYLALSDGDNAEVLLEIIENAAVKGKDVNKILVGKVKSYVKMWAEDLNYLSGDELEYTKSKIEEGKKILKELSA